MREGVRVFRCAQNSGFDLLGKDGGRYQVKQRGADVLNVDFNNFDLDYLPLVNLRDDYSFTGLWRLPAESAQKLFVFREKYRKYQATQESVKAAPRSCLSRRRSSSTRH